MVEELTVGERVMADRRGEEERNGAEQEPQGAVGGEGMWSHVRLSARNNLLNSASV